MHDLTFAREIIRAIDKRLKTTDKKAPVKAVNVLLSPLGHVTAKTLTEAFRAAAEGSGFEHVAINVKPLKPAMKCGSCGCDFRVEKPTFACPECSSPDIILTDNSEFRIESIET